MNREELTEIVRAAVRKELYEMRRADNLRAVNRELAIFNAIQEHAPKRREEAE